MFNLAAPYRAAIIIVALLASACSGGEEADKSRSKSIVTETVNNNTFKNDYFGVTVTKPDGWHALTQEQQEQMYGVGSDLASSGNDDLKRVVDASAKRTYPLFSLFMYELGAPVPINPSVMGVAENIGLLAGVKTGEDYFYHAKKFMSQTGMNYKFTDEYGKRDISGIIFDAMDVTMTFNGVSIKQTYYATRHDDHIIAFIESYGVDEFRADTSQILDSIGLDW